MIKIVFGSSSKHCAPNRPLRRPTWFPNRSETLKRLVS